MVCGQHVKVHLVFFRFEWRHTSTWLLGPLELCFAWSECDYDVCCISLLDVVVHDVVVRHPQGDFHGDLRIRNPVNTVGI